jgi:small-conductance mechanosensitive channel
LAFLALFNLEFKEVFTGVSFFAAAFAILFKDYITNLLNGMIFTFSKRITIDDYVKIGVYKGLVIDISMMHVSILNDDDDVLLLPNNYVFANEFTNYTENGQKHTTIEFEFNVQLPPDFRVLREIILQSIVEYEPYLVPESITIKVSDIREYHIKIKFHYTMKIFKRSVDKEIKKAVNAVVLQYMTEVKDLYIQKNKIT